MISFSTNAAAPTKGTPQRDPAISRAPSEARTALFIRTCPALPNKQMCCGVAMESEWMKAVDVQTTLLVVDGSDKRPQQTPYQ